MNLPGNIHNKWKISELLLLVLSIGITIALFAFHIVSAVELINYGDKVLYKNPDASFSPIPFLHVFVSITVIVLIYTFVVFLCIISYQLHKEDFNTRLLAATSITVNINHLVIYYMPYMLLAFIYNPLQTCFIYSVLGIYILCGYVVLWALLQKCNLKKEDETDDPSASNDTDNAYNLVKGSKHYFTTANIWFCIALGLLTAVIYFSVVFVYALTLGSFDDFGVIQNLGPPLLVGILTYFVVKPTHKGTKQRFNLDNDNQITKLLVGYYKQGNQHDNSHRETNGDDNHHTTA